MMNRIVAQLMQARRRPCQEPPAHLWPLASGSDLVLLFVLVVAPVFLLVSLVSASMSQ